MRPRLAVFSGLLILCVALAGATVFFFYEFLFAKTIDGKVARVERIQQTGAVIAQSGEIPASQLFSFAVAVLDSTGEIHTSSSEDRQWAVVQPGQCAQVKMFPYPPWDLTKGGTFHDARLLRLYECGGVPPSGESP